MQGVGEQTECCSSSALLPQRISRLLPALLLSQALQSRERSAPVHLLLHPLQQGPLLLLCEQKAL